VEQKGGSVRKVKKASYEISLEPHTINFINIIPVIHTSDLPRMAMVCWAETDEEAVDYFSKMTPPPKEIFRLRDMYSMAVQGKEDDDNLQDNKE
jgi:hypothetical protein